MFKNASRINCRLWKTVFVVTWIFQYFVFKPVFYWVLHHFVSKTAFSIKFNHFLFKNASRMNCSLRKTFFALNWIFQFFVLKPVFYWVFKKFSHFLFKNAFRMNCRLRKTFFAQAGFFNILCWNLCFTGFYTISCLKLRFASTVGWQRPVQF